MPRTLLVGFTLAICVLLAGCARKSEDNAAPAQANVASPPPMATATAAAMATGASMAASEDAKEGAPGGGDKKKPPEAKTWKRSEFASNTSRLTIGDKEELPLRAAQIKVTVDGFRARVLLDLFYENDRPQQYEGTFQLRLPNEASPYFFAFGKTALTADPTVLAATRSFDDAKHTRSAPEAIFLEREKSWTEPREARVVPKEKAAFAYTETVRGRIDPALMEWAGAGVFNARVFPLEKQRVHRIVVGYDVPLLAVGDDLELRIDVPDQAKSALVDIEIGDPKAAARFTPAPSREEGKRYYRFADPKEHTIALRITKPGVTVLAGEDSKTGAYFATSFAPALPASPAKAEPPSQAVFLVDTSMTANPDAFNVQLKLLESILENNRSTLKKAAVLFFNVGLSWYKDGFFDNTPENAKALLEHARTLALEGATDLGAALAEGARPAWFVPVEPQPKWNLFLLSDGAATWGESDTFALSNAVASGFSGPLFAYQTGLPGADGAALARLAKDSGGAVFSVVSETEVAAASTAHQSRAWQIKNVELKGGSDLLLAGRPKAVFPGQRLGLVGRGEPAKDAEIVLTVEQGGEEKTVRTKIARRVSSTLAARAYGETAVAAIEELDTALEPAAIAYATHFRVTGRTCSLLMLESQADYERFGINPDSSAQTVLSANAADIVASAWKKVGDALGDPKLGFLAMLARLERLDGVKLALPSEARSAIEAMPRATFEVQAPRLLPKRVTREGVPGNYEELIQTKNLDYDSAVAEAERRLKALGPADALVALSSLVEQSPGDGVLARDVGQSALAWDLPGAAYHLFRRVAIARPFEPQTYAAMASSLARMKNADLAIAYYEIALAGHWDARFGEFPKIVAADYVRLLGAIDKGTLTAGAAAYARSRKPALTALLGIEKADLVVIIGWNTDATDIDLHVVEPTGEECFYSNRVTKIGGRLTQDVTQGYGPEMYVLSQAKGGDYRVFAHYFASHQNRMSARTKVFATVFERWGSPDERVTEKTVLLAEGKADHDIAVLTR
jgi:hypothetical protein